jgi:hypothetical protein
MIKKKNEFQIFMWKVTFTCRHILCEIVYELIPEEIYGQIAQ